MNTTNCLPRNLSVTDWWLAPDPNQLIISTNSCSWPWTRLTADQWLHYWTEYDHLRNYGEWFEGLFIADYIFAIFGIVGNFLSLITLSGDYFKQPSYVYHRAIAVCDLIFNLLFIVHAWCFLNYQIVETSFVASVMRIVVQGPLFSISLTSDFVSLAIALERMIAVRFATLYSKINSHRFAKGAVVASTTLGLASRMHYSLLNRLIPRTDSKTGKVRYKFTYSYFSEGQTYANWYMISDEILPLGIMLVMGALSTLTVMAVIKRYLRRKNKLAAAIIPKVSTFIAVEQPDAISIITPGRSTYQNRRSTLFGLEQIGLKPNGLTIDRHGEQTRTATKLLIASTSMCMLNQFFFVAFTAAWQVFDGTGISFDSSADTMETWLCRRYRYNCVYLIKGVVENVSRIIHFYIYVLISTRFRKEFVRKCKCTGNRGA